MNALVVAGVWAGTGILCGPIARAFRVRRLSVAVPAAGALAARLVQPAAEHANVALAQTGLGLDRLDLGLIEAGGASLALALLIAPRLDGREGLTYGVVGSLVTIALATASPVVWAVVLLAAVGALALRWIGAAPSRTTLAAARVPGAGSASLLAAAPFLPLVGAISGPRPEIAAGLLGGGVAALLALLPLGGWAAGALGSLRAAEVAPWAFLLGPSVLVVAERIPAATPAAGDSYGRILLIAGLVTAVWQGFQANRGLPRRCYGRVLLADLGLAAAAAGSGHPGPAMQGALLMTLTHLAIGPMLLQGAGATPGRARLVGWAVLSGLPPAPSFWARFVFVQALVQVGPAQATSALVAVGMLSLAAVLGAVREAAGRPAHEAVPSRKAVAFSWLAAASATALGLAPAAAAAAVFGT